jgi:histidinol phosphatase-like enzyme
MTDRLGSGVHFVKGRECVMKKLVILILAVMFVLVLSSCKEHDQIQTGTSNTSTSTTTTENVSTTTSQISTSALTTPESTKYVLNMETPIEDDGSGMYYFGMNREDFLNVVRKNGWLLAREITYYPFDLSEKIYYNKEYLDGGCYDFNEQDELISMDISGQNIKTSKGIKVGDTVDKMKAAYGEEPVEQQGDDNDMVVYFVYHPSPKTALKFAVYGDNDTITSWELSANFESTSESTVSETKAYVINKETPIEDDGTGMFYFGMKRDDFLNIVRENGWLIGSEIMNRPYDSYERIYYDSNLLLEAGVYFFDEQEKIIGVGISGYNMKTSRGIKIGDTVSQMKAAYGQQPVEQKSAPTVGNNDPGVYFVYHPSPKTSLEFEVYGDTITSWELKVR